MGKLLSVNLLQRVLVAVVGIPLLLWLIQAGGVWFFRFSCYLHCLLRLSFIV